jgi:hypothetical protein
MVTQLGTQTLPYGNYVAINCVGDKEELKKKPVFCYEEQMVLINKYKIY